MDEIITKNTTKNIYNTTFDTPYKIQNFKKFGPDDAGFFKSYCNVFLCMFLPFKKKLFLELKDTENRKMFEALFVFI